MNDHTPERITWIIDDIVRETPLVSSLVLRSEEPIAFIPGQYLTVLLPHQEPREGKSYSISSVPGGTHVTLTVKRMGTFSRTLSDMRVGDTLTTSLPYGFFYPEAPMADMLVFIAGGIGITPLMSIIESLLQGGYGGPLRLFYSNQTTSEITFRERLSLLASQYPNLSVNHFVTRESTEDGFVTEGRLSPHHIVTSLPDRTSCDFFLCGSSTFTRELWSQLKACGIKPAQIYTEGFF